MTDLHIVAAEVRLEQFDRNLPPIDSAALFRRFCKETIYDTGLVRHCSYFHGQKILSRDTERGLPVVHVNFYK